MIILHFHLQLQFKNELFHVYIIIVIVHHTINIPKIFYVN